MKAERILLFIVLICCGVSGYFSYEMSQEIKALKAQSQVTEQKVDSLMIVTAKIAQSSKVVKSNSQPKSFWEMLFSELEAEQKAATAQRKAQVAKQKVTVSTSYRLEDRYVVGDVELPDHSGDQSGRITVKVWVNQSGSVKKTSVMDGASITDPEVIESTRKAALKTDFNRDYDAPESVEGTITYIFKKK